MSMIATLYTAYRPPASQRAYSSGRNGSSRNDVMTNGKKMRYAPTTFTLRFLNCHSTSSATAAVSEQPIETLTVTLGETLEEPYLSYNDLQRSQGFDLTRYCGQTLSRYTYVVTNYPDASLPCQADLYVCDGALAAGDIVCTGENGFMAGLAFPAG